MKTSSREIVLPEGFTAAVSGHTISVSAQGKTVSRDLGKENVGVQVQGNKIFLHAERSSKKENKLLNTLESHVQNLVKGLQKPFEYRLAVVYSHFPMMVSVKGEWVEINNFMGEKKPRKSRILPDAQVEIKGKEIMVRGNNKDQVGQTAANLENATRVVGKDRRVYQDGIFIVRTSH